MSLRHPQAVAARCQRVGEAIPVKSIDIARVNEVTSASGILTISFQ